MNNINHYPPGIIAWRHTWNTTVGFQYRLMFNAIVSSFEFPEVPAVTPFSCKSVYYSLSLWKYLKHLAVCIIIIFDNGANFGTATGFKPRSSGWSSRPCSTSSKPVSQGMLYKEVEFILEFCFVLIVVSSAFIISILARKIQLHIDAYRAWHNWRHSVVILNCCLWPNCMVVLQVVPIDKKVKRQENLHFLEKEGVNGSLQKAAQTLDSSSTRIQRFLLPANYLILSWCRLASLPVGKKKKIHGDA